MNKYLIKFVKKYLIMFKLTARAVIYQMKKEIKTFPTRKHLYVRMIHSSQIKRYFKKTSESLKENYRPKWMRLILNQKIKGYNSRMDNWRVVEGAYNYSKNIPGNYLFNGKDYLKERLYKLYQLNGICYSRKTGDYYLECEGEWFFQMEKT